MTSILASLRVRLAAFAFLAAVCAALLFAVQPGSAQSTTFENPWSDGTTTITATVTNGIVSFTAVGMPSGAYWELLPDDRNPNSGNAKTVRTTPDAPDLREPGTVTNSIEQALGNGTYRWQVWDFNPFTPVRVGQGGIEITVTGAPAPLPGNLSRAVFNDTTSAPNLPHQIWMTFNNRSSNNNKQAVTITDRPTRNQDATTSQYRYAISRHEDTAPLVDTDERLGSNRLGSGGSGGVFPADQDGSYWVWNVAGLDDDGAFSDDSTNTDQVARWQRLGEMVMVEDTVFVEDGWIRGTVNAAGNRITFTVSGTNEDTYDVYVGMKKSVIPTDAERIARLGLAGGSWTADVSSLAGSGRNDIEVRFWRSATPADADRTVDRARTTGVLEDDDGGEGMGFADARVMQLTLGVNTTEPTQPPPPPPPPPPPALDPVTPVSPLLSGLDLTAAPGESCGIVGLSWDNTAATGETNYQIYWRLASASAASFELLTSAPPSLSTIPLRPPSGQQVVFRILVDGGDNHGSYDDSNAVTASSAGCLRSYSVTVNDSDGVVDTPAVLSITVSGLDAAGDPVPAGTDLGAYTLSISPKPAVHNFLEGNRLVIGDGSSDGIYRLSAVRVNTDGTSVTGFVDIEVGGAGRPVGSIELGFGYQSNGACISEEFADRQMPPVPLDDFMALRGGRICVVATILNTIGNEPSSELEGDLIVFAPGGEVNGLPNTSEIGFRAARGNGFWVSRSTLGPLTVSARALTEAGFVVSNNLELNFTGEASVFQLGRTSGSLSIFDAMSAIEFPITSQDGNGNTAELEANTLSFAFLDSAGGDVDHFTASLGRTGENDDGARVVDVVFADGTEGVPSGLYVLRVTLGQVTQEATFAVAGAPESVRVTVDQRTGLRFGQIITATATFTDENGYAAANDEPVQVTMDDPEDVINDPPNQIPALDENGNAIWEGGVRFTAAGLLNVVPLNSAPSSLRNGVATAQFLISGGSGVAVIIATDGSITNSIQVTSFGEPLVPSTELTADCLSGLQDFASWVCTNDGTAEEIFELIQPRGATALHLWNGASWVRYATVGGVVVPGSNNFTISLGDVLFVSN